MTTSISKTMNKHEGPFVTRRQMSVDDKARKRKKHLKIQMIFWACTFPIIYYLLNSFSSSYQRSGRWNAKGPWGNPRGTYLNYKFQPFTCIRGFWIWEWTWSSNIRNNFYIHKFCVDFSWAFYLKGTCYKILVEHDCLLVVNFYSRNILFTFASSFTNYPSFNVYT